MRQTAFRNPSHLTVKAAAMRQKAFSCCRLTFFNLPTTNNYNLITMANQQVQKRRRSERIAIRRPTETTKTATGNVPSLPVEIKEMIFSELGRPPQDSIYIVDAIEHIHPCYAICSTSKQFQAIYFRKASVDSTLMLSDKIEITIRPKDYLVPDEDLGKMLTARLELLGHYGRARVTGCHIYGDQLKRETGDARLTKWLSAGQVKKRLEPEHKALLKQHIEQDLQDKAVAITKLFKLITEKLPHITALKISPGEIPSNVWYGPVKQWVVQHKQNTLQEFEFVKINTFLWRFNYHYINRLSAKFGVLDDREAPSNYPPADWENQRAFEELEKAINHFIGARNGLTNFQPRAWSW